MDEPRFERELRTMLAQDLEPIHGPHPRWIGSPVAVRIQRARGLTRRRSMFALLAAVLVVVLMVAALGIRRSDGPAATPAASPSWTATASPGATAATSGGCPTLADYRAEIASPSPTPPPPVFAPVAPDTKPTTGTLAFGQVGVLAAPDGSPGALVRVSNPRFCSRLPDVRLEQYTLGALPGDFRLLLTDVEFTVLKAGSLGQAFIPGSTVVTATSRAGFSNPYPVPYDFPGSDPRSRLAPSAGFSYSGTMSWIVDITARVAVEVGVTDPAAFDYVVQDGPTDSIVASSPQTVVLGATPSTGTPPLDTWATISADGALMPVRVGAVQVVDGYPRVVPSQPGDRFLEVFGLFGVPSAPYTIDAGDWVLVGPDGHDIPRLTDPGSSAQPLLPGLATPWTATRRIDPADRFMFPMFVVAEVSPTGRITLEYRPHGGPAEVTWIVRDH